MFNFRFYSNQLSQATRGMAAGVFVTGLMLVGFGLLIFALPRVFATLAALFFGIVGASVIGFAIRLFFASRRIDRARKDYDAYRDNVTIHHDDREIY